MSAPRGHAPAALELDGLTKSFGDLRAVDDVCLEVAAGEVFGLLGPNGAGKTTTIRMICAETAPDAGRVLLHGRPLTAAADDRARIGLCPQELVVWPKLTCVEQLEMTGSLYGLPGRAARRRATDLLDELGLAEKARALGGTLSGGQQRRLNIALALVHDPELVILDVAVVLPMDNGGGDGMVEAAHRGAPMKQGNANVGRTAAKYCLFEARARLLLRKTLCSRTN